MLCFRKVVSYVLIWVFFLKESVLFFLNDLITDARSKFFIEEHLEQIIKQNISNTTNIRNRTFCVPNCCCAIKELLGWLLNKSIVHILARSNQGCGSGFGWVGSDSRLVGSVCWIRVGLIFYFRRNVKSELYFVGSEILFFSKVRIRVFLAVGSTYSFSWGIRSGWPPPGSTTLTV